jgi:hypothetical protein
LRGEYVHRSWVSASKFSRLRQLMANALFSALLPALLVATLARNGYAQNTSVIKPESDAARVLREEAVEAAKKGDWETCRQKSAASFDTDRQPKAAGLLGYCEVELKLFRDAAEHLDYALRYDTDPSRQADYRTNLNEAKRKIGTMQVTANVDACAIRLDAKIVGQAPITIYVHPGEYVVQAEKLGYKPARKVIKIKASYDEDVNLELTIDESNPPPSTGFPVWPGIVVGSVGAIAMGIGGAFLAVADGNGADAKSKGDGVECNSPSVPGACSEVASALDDRDTFGNAGIGLLVGGGVAAAAGVGLVVGALVGSSSSDAPKSALVPLLAPGTSGLLFHTSF